MYKQVSDNLYKLMGGEGMTEERFETIRKLAREEWRKGNATGCAMLDLIQEVQRCHKEIERYAQFEEQYQRFKQKYEEFEQKYKEFEEQNQRYREALETIGNMHRLTHSVTDAIEVAKKALEGEQ